MDPLDATEVIKLTNLSATGTSGSLAVQVEIDSAGGTVIPVNDYDGDWPDLQTLEEYLEDLFGLPSRPDICQDNGLLWDSYSQSGFFARFDPGTGTWANDQTQNVILAAISDGDGDVYIDGEKIIGGRVVLGTGCVTDSDLPLEGDTCATTYSYVIGNSNVCDDGPNQTQLTKKISLVEEKDITWNGFTTLVQMSGTWNSNFKIETKRVVADNITVTGFFYDSAGDYQETGGETEVLSDYAGHERPFDGACAYPGEAERDTQSNTTKFIQGLTRSGTAPISCPSE